MMKGTEFFPACAKLTELTENSEVDEANEERLTEYTMKKVWTS